jgi:ABC-type phosphate transport system substrate-binding protein
MKKTLVKISIVFLFFSINASAQEKYAVISNKNLTHLSLSQIKAIFLKKVSYINDMKVVPINLNSRNKIRNSFEKNVLMMNLSRLKSYWIKQHYLGHRPPITMKSEESLKAFVKKIDGAIGYINIKNVDSEINVLYEWSD